MTNLELLTEAGWYELDGWMCDPKLDGEEVFLIKDIEDHSLPVLFATISSSAFNRGSRWQKQDMKDTLKQRIISIANNIDNM
jgi:hypothetical protein